MEFYDEKDEAWGRRTEQDPKLNHEEPPQCEGNRGLI